MRRLNAKRIRVGLTALSLSVGMANIWGFPYKFQTGGWVFLIFFIIFVAIFAIFGLASELAIGRLSKTDTIGAYEYAFFSKGMDTKYGRVLGTIAYIGAFLISIGYCAILSYIFKGLVDSITGEILIEDPHIWFNSYARVSYGLSAYHGMVVLFAVLICFVKIESIKKVYEKVMPLFIVMLIVLAIEIFFKPNAIYGYRHMFRFNKDTMNLTTILYAMGEAFFALSIIGSGMIVVGAGTSDDVDLIAESVDTWIFDALVGLVISLVIIPAISVYGLTNVDGPTLLFLVMPTVFKDLHLARIAAIFFYLSVTFAGLVAISNMFEVIVKSLSVRHKKIPEKILFILVGLIVFVLGLGLETVHEFTVYMNIVLMVIVPLGASIGAITWFYFLDKDMLLNEINKSRERNYGDIWYNLGKYFYVPLTIILTILAIYITFSH